MQTSSYYLKKKKEKENFPFTTKVNKPASANSEILLSTKRKYGTRLWSRENLNASLKHGQWEQAVRFQLHDTLGKAKLRNQWNTGLSVRGKDELAEHKRTFKDSHSIQQMIMVTYMPKIIPLMPQNQLILKAYVSYGLWLVMRYQLYGLTNVQLHVGQKGESQYIVNHSTIPFC